MRRLWQLVLGAVFVVGATHPAAAQSSPPPDTPLQDPEKLFRKACERLVALEGKHELLKGVSDIKPVISRDDGGKLKGAHLTLQRNAVPYGKGEAKAEDESRPFAFVAIQVWAGRTPSPAADMYTFAWRGQIYQAWVRAISSNTELVKGVRKTVADPMSEPSVVSLSPCTSPSIQAFRSGQPLVFEGLAVTPIHRPGPEHFKLTRVTDGQAVPLHVAYDRERVEQQREGTKRSTPALETTYAYNSLFRGTRLFLYNGIFSAKDPVGKSGVLDLYGCPKLAAGVRYRLTWACWPVGEGEAVEESCEFELGK
jgi:hypothetical protein